MYITEDTILIAVVVLAISIMALCWICYSRGSEKGYRIGVNYADTKWSELADFYMPMVVSDTMRGKITGLYGRYVTKNKR